MPCFGQHQAPFASTLAFPEHPCGHPALTPSARHPPSFCGTPGGHLLVPGAVPRTRGSEPRGLCRVPVGAVGATGTVKEQGQRGCVLPRALPGPQGGGIVSRCPSSR